MDIKIDNIILDNPLYINALYSIIGYDKDTIYSLLSDPLRELIQLINEIIVENTLHDLFYKNYEEMFKYANDPIGLDIKIEEKDISILNGFKQIRNLYIHGDGNINLLFMKKIQRYKITFEDLTLTDLSIGEEIKVDMKLIKKLEKLTFKIVGIIDDSLESKYPELLENV